MHLELYLEWIFSYALQWMKVWHQGRMINQLKSIIIVYTILAFMKVMVLLVVKKTQELVLVLLDKNL